MSEEFQVVKVMDLKGIGVSHAGGQSKQRDKRS